MLERIACDNNRKALGTSGYSINGRTGTGEVESKEEMIDVVVQTLKEAEANRRPRGEETKCFFCPQPLTQVTEFLVL